MANFFGTWILALRPKRANKISLNMFGINVPPAVLKKRLFMSKIINFCCILLNLQAKIGTFPIIKACNFEPWKFLFIEYE